MEIEAAAPGVRSATARRYDERCCFLTPGVAAANIDFCPQKAQNEKRSVKLSLSGTFLANSHSFPMNGRRTRPRRLAWPRTSPFHGGNTGSNPVGDAKSFQQLMRDGSFSRRHKKAQYLDQKLSYSFGNSDFSRRYALFSKAQKGTTTAKEVQLAHEAEVRNSRMTSL